MLKSAKIFLALIVSLNLYGCQSQENLKASAIFALPTSTDYLNVVLDSETICIYKVKELKSTDPLLKKIVEWFNNLELKGIIYEESPAFKCSGGLTYKVTTKDNRSFAYCNACGDYLIIEDKWYEILNPTPFPSESVVPQIK